VPRCAKVALVRNGHGIYPGIKSRDDAVPGGERVLFAANMRGFRDEVISEENSEDRKDYRDDDRPGALFM